MGRFDTNVGVYIPEDIFIQIWIYEFYGDGFVGF